MHPETAAHAVPGEQLARTLHGSGLRATPAALAVLRTLTQAAAPLTHDNIAARVAADVAVDRVTLYRILDRLTRAGLVQRLQGPDRIWRFHPSGDTATAGMFACTRCHSTAPLPSSAAWPQALAEMQERLRAQGLYGVAAEVTVHGLCRHCQGRREEPHS